jgi:sporulation protein YlmC with PRC-barrel domain
MTRSCLALTVIFLFLLAPNGAPAQVAGSTVFGLDVVELRQVAIGWSAKHQILGKPVYNDRSEQIGRIDDIIIAPDRAVSYAIIGVGGFLGVARHDVAVSVSQLRIDGDKLVLAGATKEALKATPPFEYAKSPR